MIAVGARCTDGVRANELLVFRGYCLCTVRGILRVATDYSTSHVLAIGGMMDKVDQAVSECQSLLDVVQ